MANDINSIKVSFPIGKDRLVWIHWFVIYFLSLAISLLTLFIPVGSPYLSAVVSMYPAIVFIAAQIIRAYDTMGVLVEESVIEPNERVFDKLGVARFYQDRNVKYARKRHIKFRAEANLKGEEVYRYYLRAAGRG